ncbi:MAG TPA: hypothetical protein DEQ34_10485 [Balneolaceae bacterium]|nr:hypothetical protein [Balneolaceae bacterium]
MFGRHQALLQFLLCVAFIQTGSAQTATLSKDSLEYIVNHHLEEDTIRVNALIDLQEYYLVDEFEAGKVYIEEALSISKKINYQTGIGFSSNALSSYFLRRGEQDSALFYTLEAIEVFESINEDQNIYAAYNNLGLIYKNKGEYEKAVEIYKRMLDRLDGREITPSFAIVYFNIASIYEAQNDWENYEPCIQKMLETSKELNFTPGIIEAELGLAKVAMNNGNNAEAFNLANSVLTLAQDSGEMAQTAARAFYILGDIYYSERDFRKAIFNYEQSLEIYEELNSLHYAAEIYLKLSDLYRDISAFDKALKHRITYHHIQDSLNSLERVALIEELQTKFETERIKREKETAELENLKLAEENRKGRGILFGVVGLLGFVVMASGFYTRQQKLKKQNELATLQLEESEKRLAIEKKKREAELSAIRSQLNPHFIFNLLNTIQGLSVNGDRSAANKALNNVAVMMRMILKHSQEAFIPLRSELDLIRIYLEAEQLRFGDRISFEIMMDEEVEDEFITIPPMLIQPYVENAIKHGLMHKTEPGKIEVHIHYLGEDMLEIIVEDDGIGRKRAAEIKYLNPGEHNTFSTKANQDRIENLAKESDSEARVEIIDKYSETGNPAGTKVRILIPTNLGNQS